MGPRDAALRVRGTPANAVRLRAGDAAPGWAATGGTLAAHGWLSPSSARVKLPERILFVGAHCDDIELCAGGLLARACFAGSRVGVLVFSDHRGVVDEETARQARREFADNIAWLRTESGNDVRDHSSEMLPACQGAFETERARL